MFSTLLREFRVLFPAAVTASSIIAPGLTTTKPTGGVYGGTGATRPRDGENALTFNAMTMMFTGTGGQNKTGIARVTGWRNTGGLAPIWIPQPLLVLAFTTGNIIGVAGADITNLDFVADTITATTASTTCLDSNSYAISQGADDQPAFLRFDTFGCELVQVQLAVSGGSPATAVNCLAAGF